MPDELVEWIEPDGAGPHPIPGVPPAGTIALLRGSTGRFMPEFHRVADTIPGQPGERLRSYRRKARTLNLPVRLREDTATELRALLRTWAYRLDPLRGDGILRVTDYDGAQREIVCRYLSGAEGDESQGFLAAGHLKETLQFVAADPDWLDIADTTAAYGVGTVGTFFPIPPLVLSSSEVFADATINNTGDYATWPLWTITGPGASIILRNLTTGHVLSITDPDVTLGAGESITVDTRPYRKAVTKNDGTNLFPNLTDLSAFWPLEVGNNSVRVEMGAATAASSVQLAYRRRHRTA